MSDFDSRWLNPAPIASSPMLRRWAFTFVGSAIPAREVRPVPTYRDQPVVMQRLRRICVFNFAALRLAEIEVLSIVRQRVYVDDPTNELLGLGKTASGVDGVWIAKPRMTTGPAKDTVIYLRDKQDRPLAGYSFYRDDLLAVVEADLKDWARKAKEAADLKAARLKEFRAKHTTLQTPLAHGRRVGDIVVVAGTHMVVVDVPTATTVVLRPLAFETEDAGWLERALRRPATTRDRLRKAGISVDFDMIWRTT